MQRKVQKLPDTRNPLVHVVPPPPRRSNQSKLHPPGARRQIRIVINPIPKPTEPIGHGREDMSHHRTSITPAETLNPKPANTVPQQTIKKKGLGGSRHLACDHKARRTQCALCNGGSVCSHGRQKHLCKDCGGTSLCEHQRQKSKCKVCNNK